MKLVWVAPLLALTLAACGQVGAIGIPLGGGTQAAATGQPTDFNQAAPTTAVETGTLPPAEGYDPGPVATTPPTGAGPLPPANAIGEPNQVGALAANAATDVRSPDIIGGWTVTTGNTNCRLFLTLTAWTGDYFRASTQPMLGQAECASSVLRSVGTWSLSGNVVTLASADGTSIATLAPVSALRFEGQLLDGTPVFFFR
ncbi:MAG: AprI/Inh family metalloprotease inhibitor [Bauldia sp.]|nr:AprI/Inh family metalloprotease inhibitor [Bauldia sp.]MCW5718731.1 AprI/Inh family metalloprotease inhibitor [Bauldia sp.]